MDLTFVLLSALLILPCIFGLLRRNYEGHQVFRVKAQHKRHLDVILSLRNEYENELSRLVDFWTEPGINTSTDIMVSHRILKRFHELLDFNSIPKVLIMDNVEKLISNHLSLNLKNGSLRIDWTNYNRYDDVMDWLDELGNNYAEATVENVGASYEGRDLKLIRVSTGGSPNKPIILIDGGFHAREWISPAVVTYIISQLVTNSSAYSDILDYFDFHLLPISNPDGYEFTHTSDRLWRKTRSTFNGTTCRGVDPNRNFDIDFGGNGSSSNPCDIYYNGPVPFSEPETATIRDHIIANRQRIIAYFSFHSYSQSWLTPYAWSDSPPPDFEDIMRVGKSAIDALRSVYGTSYVVGPTSTTLYFHSGASQDWAKDAGIKYTYTPELRDTGYYGFLLPPHQIIPTCIETWVALQAAVREIIQIEFIK